MEPVIRVTKEFHFEMGHVLWNYDGPCRNVHGHSYRLYVTVSGVPSDNPSDPKNGMVMDFTVLKRIVRKEITEVFDHSVVLNSRHDNARLDSLKSLLGNVVLVDYQPTCENLVADFAGRIAIKLPEGVKLFSLKLYETATSYAEWFASDNQ
ncbi:MAG TPA: 6-carboxytetrahydropterin synthase [Bacteroidales bacterium]|jgi:6-pyruvoyltetrahydropterin/6-carboxytetrahydropterin synthase|nr:6-carboxytetrahydropterin synthase [Bacteroidales bacterium]